MHQTVEFLTVKIKLSIRLLAAAMQLGILKVNHVSVYYKSLSCVMTIPLFIFCLQDCVQYLCNNFFFLLHLAISLKVMWKCTISPYYNKCYNSGELCVTIITFEILNTFQCTKELLYTNAFFLLAECKSYEKQFALFAIVSVSFWWWLIVKLILFVEYKCIYLQYTGLGF